MGKENLEQNFPFVNSVNSNVLWIYSMITEYHFIRLSLLSNALIQYLIPSWAKLYIDISLYLMINTGGDTWLKHWCSYTKNGCIDLHEFSKLKRNHTRITIMKEILVCIRKTYLSSYFLGICVYLKVSTYTNPLKILLSVVFLQWLIFCKMNILILMNFSKF